MASDGDAVTQVVGDFDDTVTLAELRRRLAMFAKERDWDQFHTPRNLVLAMTGEVGELAELFQWRGDAGSEVGLEKWSDSDLVHLSEELADVQLYLLRLADRCNINLPAAVLRKLRRNAEKYPADRVRGSSKKYTEYRTQARADEAAKAAARATAPGEGFAASASPSGPSTATPAPAATSFPAVLVGGALAGAVVTLAITALTRRQQS